MHIPGPQQGGDQRRIELAMFIVHRPFPSVAALRTCFSEGLSYCAAQPTALPRSAHLISTYHALGHCTRDAIEYLRMDIGRRSGALFIDMLQPHANWLVTKSYIHCVRLHGAKRSEARN